MYTLRDRTTLDLLGDVSALLGPDALRDMQHCVAVLDRRGCITACSQGGLNAFGLSPDRVQSHTLFWWDIWPDASRAPVREAVMRGLSGHITQYWCPFSDINGRISQWDMRLAPLFDASALTASVIVVSQPLTRH